MKATTKEEFYLSVGSKNVHPYIVSNNYPYTTEWRFPSGEVFGKIVPEIGRLPHLFTNRYFLKESK